MDESKFLIIGAKGQLGLALKEKYPDARAVDIDELDITDTASIEAYDWSGIELVLNAAAYTNVDGAETADGRVSAWKVNAAAPSLISKIALRNKFTLLHISTDYVFDGSREQHDELEPFSPLGVYGASKAAGDIAVSMISSYYILRTSWVIGEGNNFVRTMLELGKKGVNPKVVNDQIGRLTFTTELVRAIDHIVTTRPAFGTYNVSNGGSSESWAEITRKIYSLAGLENTVTDTTTSEYFKDKPESAPRPPSSTLLLDKLRATGFTSIDWTLDLADYIKKELAD